MNNTMVKTYQNRIVNANRKELLLLNYELLMVEIEESIEALKVDNEKAFDNAMVKAHGFLRELSDNLNLD